MWCPEDYYSWDYVLDHLVVTSSQILSLVALGGELSIKGIDEDELKHTVEYYLEDNGLADSKREAELIVTITACYLMSRFLEEYPPVLASLDGSKITVNEVFFEHKDQLTLCHYSWPPNRDPQFFNFFKYQRDGVFEPRDIFERFAFIDPRFGEFGVKNGTRHFLINGVGCEEKEAEKLIETASKLAGHIVCWRDVPDEEDLRNFLSYLEVDDTFTMALDKTFGLATEDSPPQEKRPKGRPSKQQAASREYWRCFPQGHNKSGKTWKEALRSVNDKLDVPVEITTLKRSLRKGGQKQQK